MVSIQAAEAKDQQELLNVSDHVVFATYFTFAGLVMGLACLTGRTWAWYTAGGLLLVVSLLSAIQLWRLWQREKELLRRGVKLPDTGPVPEQLGIKRLLSD
jgi:hypothetical protein